MHNHTNLIGKIATVEKDVKLYHSHKQEHDRVSEEKAMYERLEHITSPNGYSLHMLQHYTSDKNILYARRLVVYRNQRRWWCKKQGNKDCD